MSNIIYDNSNWADRIARAKLTGKFTEDDLLRASCWESCAVGERLQQAGVVEREVVERAAKALVRNIDEVLEDPTRYSRFRQLKAYFIKHTRKAKKQEFKSAYEAVNIKASALGMAFMHQVENHDVDRAEATYQEILKLRTVLTDRALEAMAKV
jgi:hypothetical protein